MPNEAYAAYLQSNTWKAKRLQRLKKDKNRCQGCGATEKLHVHHKTYERFGGKERMTDLVVVCESCHTTIHQMHQALKGAALEQVTDRTLKQLKAAGKSHWEKAEPLSPDPHPDRRQRRPGKNKKKPERTEPFIRDLGGERDSDSTLMSKARHRGRKVTAKDLKRRNGT